jgi:hypothetical protein
MSLSPSLVEMSTMVDSPPAQPKLRARPLALNSFSSPQLGLNPRPADEVWTRQSWTELCEYLHNDNPETHFVMGFQDKQGCKRYVRSRNKTVDRVISWAFSSIAGNPKSRVAFVPYSQNSNQQSRWGGMDFDAHNGESARAEELALKAYRFILGSCPNLAVILETSGSGGWHVWAIAQEYHSVGDWVRLLKQVASAIGTTIASGVCEIFPASDSTAKFGKAMRAPGSWNPATNQSNQICFENVGSLDLVLSGNSNHKSSNSQGFRDQFPDREKNVSFSSPYRGDEWLKTFGITEVSTRNSKLSGLVGEVFHQVGHSMAHRLALCQFRQKTVLTKANEAEHMESFKQLWSGLYADWVRSLTGEEKAIYNQLVTDNERDAFRIIRSYAGKAKEDGVMDFPVVRDNLGERLGMSGKGAGKVRDKLAKLEAIRKTANFVCNKAAARFRWIADVIVDAPF